MKSSGLDCCTYDCTQGRDCPVRQRKLEEVNEKQPQYYSRLIARVSRWLKVKRHSKANGDRQSFSE
jgi:hypothetical protein